MSHADARLAVRGRMLIVERRRDGWKQGHIAAAMGISRKCVGYWLHRFAAEGEAGLADRSSRPHRCPTRTSAEVEAQVVALRRVERRGRDQIAAELGVPARTVSRILARHTMSQLAVLDPMTGERLRASETTAMRCNVTGLASWSTWTSRSWAASPTAAAGAPTGRGPGDNRETASTAPATTTFTRSWTTTPPGLRRDPARRERCHLRRFLTRAIDYVTTHGLPASNACGSTALGPTAGRCALSAPSTASGRGSSSHTAPGRTARSSVSTAPWPRRGPTGRFSPRTPNVPRHWHRRSSTTTPAVVPRPAGCTNVPAGCG